MPKQSKSKTTRGRKTSQKPLAGRKRMGVSKSSMSSLGSSLGVSKRRTRKAS